MKFRSLFSGWLVVVGYLNAASISQAGTIYYGLFGAPTSIGVSQADGTSYKALINDNSIVEGFAVDSAGGKIYWGDATNPGGTNNLYRANLDGTGVQTLDTNSSGIGGVGLDLNAGKVYFGDIYGLYEANLDGTSKTKLVSGYLFYDVNVYGNKVYWSNVNGIESANLDGTNVQTLVTGQSSIAGLDVEGSLGKMFWVDQSSGKVQSANLDGSGATLIASSYLGVRGVAVDTSTDRIYWGFGNNNTVIYNSKLDGSDVQHFTPASGLSVGSLQIVSGPLAAAPAPSSLTLLGTAFVTVLLFFGWPRRKLAVA